jgi:2-keto-4-pentenoate hydratase/2-oxohepta-3-ene-1,7-dioic acid hydratase in catechol pathway
VSERSPERSPSPDALDLLEDKAESMRAVSDPVCQTDGCEQRVVVRLNGRARQDYPLADMILPPARIVALLSREMTLEPGDLIACGTSVGVLPMRAGMVVEVEIGGIGTLRNVFSPEGSA